MIKIDKSYTIKYSKGGILQYATFRYAEGKLITHDFRPSWVKTAEVPSLEGLTDIEEILAVIKNFSYANNAEIILINHNLPDFTSGDALKKCKKAYNDFVSPLCTNFFKSEILPILRKNKWKISRSWGGRPSLIKKVNKEWDNVNTYHKDSKLIDNITNRFVNQILRLEIELDFKSEYGYVSGDSFGAFFNYLDENELEKLKIFITLD